MEVIERAGREVGLPAAIRVDDGTEFGSRDLDLLAYQRRQLRPAHHRRGPRTAVPLHRRPGEEVRPTYRQRQPSPARRGAGRGECHQGRQHIHRQREALRSVGSVPVVGGDAQGEAPRRAGRTPQRPRAIPIVGEG